MTQQTIKAIIFERGGDAREVLSMADVPVPVRGPDEVLIKMDARPIQPADFMFINDRYRIKPQFPQVAGLEGTGLVLEAPADSHLIPGDRVAVRAPGTWAEVMAAPRARVYKAPPQVKVDAAAQFSLNPITAYALLDELKVKQGDCIAINAATSAVAQIVADLALRRGVGVVGLIRSGTNVELPFATIQDSVDDLGAAALAAVGNQPFAGLLDCIGGPAIKAMLPAMRQGGTIVSYGVFGKEPIQLSNADMIYRNLCWKGFGIDFWLGRATPEQRAAMYDELWTAITQPVAPLPLTVRARYSLAQVGDAVAAAMQTGVLGKVILAS